MASRKGAPSALREQKDGSGFWWHQSTKRLTRLRSLALLDEDIS